MRFLKTCLLAAVTLSLTACVMAPDEPSLTGEYLAGRLAAKKNAVDDAARAFSDAYADAPAQEDILRNAFFYHLVAGHVEEAGIYAARILKDPENANDGMARVTLASIALKKNDYKAARTYLEGSFDAPFLKSAAYLSNVWIEDALHGPQAAIAKLEIGPGELFKGFNPLHRALLFEKAGENDEARTAHQVSVFGLGGSVGRIAYGVFLERSDDEDAAREYYTLLHREAGAARRIAEAGLARIEKGEKPKIFSNVNAQQGAAIGFYSFGAIILEQSAGERARAEEAGFNVGEPRYNLPLALNQLAIYLDPTLYEARNLVGQVFNVYGDFEAAAESLREIPPSSPLYEQSRVFIAGGVAARGDVEEAIAMLRDVVKRDPTALEAQFSLANLYAGDGRHDEAVATVSSIIDGLGPEPEEDAWRYYISRAASLLELDRWEEAEADLEKAVELAPEEATTLNYLGYSWAERGKNLEKAFELIEKAVELQPNSGAIIDSLGWAHYQRGDYKKAVGHLEEAASREPSDPTITDHLGDVYWKLGRTIEARYQWRRVLELETPEKLRIVVEEKLKSGLKDTSSLQ